MVSLQATPATMNLRDAANLGCYQHLRLMAWRGAGMDKCPADLICYQEIIWALRPPIIIETGTWFGGSALFFADMCELAGAGQVLSIDIAPETPLPSHPRLTYLLGDSTSPETLAAVTTWADGEQGLVVLDSAHDQEHVLAELADYHRFVAPGMYLVVEDTNINGHPVRPDFGPGPYEAVQRWLPNHPDFSVDSEGEPYLTNNPGGYLRRADAQIREEDRIVR